MANTLKYQGYTATIDYSNEDKVYFGKVTGISDLITFEGTSATELEKAFK